MASTLFDDVVNGEVGEGRDVLREEIAVGGFAYAGSACDDDVGERARHGWKSFRKVHRVDNGKSCGDRRMSSLDVL